MESCLFHLSRPITLSKGKSWCSLLYKCRNCPLQEFVYLDISMSNSRKFSCRKYCPGFVEGLSRPLSCQQKSPHTKLTRWQCFQNRELGKIWLANISTHYHRIHVSWSAQLLLSCLCAVDKDPIHQLHRMRCTQCSHCCWIMDSCRDLTNRPQKWQPLS